MTALLNSSLVRGQIGFAEESSLRDVPPFQRVRDVATVEAIRNRLEPVIPASPALCSASMGFRKVTASSACQLWPVSIRRAV
jgi:hypothetical protein